MMSLWKVSTLFDDCREIVDFQPTCVGFSNIPHQLELGASHHWRLWISSSWMLMPEVLDKRAPSLCLTLSDCGHLKKPHVNFITCHFCQYGTAWKKPTSFLCGQIHPDELHRLTKVCHGRGTCSPHFQLSGSRNDGTPWTKIAEPYPAKLCQDLAYTLTSHLHTLSTKQFLSW